MKLFDKIKAISSTLSKPFSNMKYKTISVESIQAQIEDVKWSLTNTDAALSLLDEKQFDAAYERVLNKLRTDHHATKAFGKPAVEFITDIHKHLEGKARNIGLYKSMTLTSETFGKMLDELQTNLPSLMLNREGIVINDIQISHVLFLGVIESIQIYSSMTGYLIALMSHVMSASKSDHYASLPKYMVDYLAKYGTKYIECINDMCNNPGASIVSQIDPIRKKGVDFRMVSETDDNVGGLGALAAIGASLGAISLAKWMIGLGIAAFATGVVNIPLIGEKYIEMRHEWFELNKQRKKWLESHVANMKLSLEGVNENDPEYLKLQKIIVFYDDELARLDKKLQKYYNV